ncbi:hypothetical protein [Roseibium alexandrii]
MKNVQDFDWDEIREALDVLLADCLENEPAAVNYHRAVQDTLDGLPENE